MGLYLSCGLCGRKQADGLISRGFWGHLELENGSARRACPTCKEEHRDWPERLREQVNGGPSGGTANGSPGSP